MFSIPPFCHEGEDTRTTRSRMNNNNNKQKLRDTDAGLSPVYPTATATRQGQVLKAPPTPPSPPGLEIPWGDRKPAAKPKPFHHDLPATEPATEVELEIEVAFDHGGTGTALCSSTKDGLLFPKKSPLKKTRKTLLSTNEKNNEDRSSSGGGNSHDAGSKSSHQDPGGSDDRMSKRELFWATFVFAVIALLVCATTAIVMNRDANSKTLETNHHSKDKTDGTPAGGPPSGRTPISVPEEWELVRTAVRSNPVTRVLFEGRGGRAAKLSPDLEFYHDLVSGMVFSHEHRDWIPAPYSPKDDDDDDYYAMEGMSMVGTFGEFGSHHHHPGGSTTTTTKLTPHQKATAWLLFEDDRKDPHESVWRWVLACLYFQMGGSAWDFSLESNHQWLTSAPVCDWERLWGSSGCDKILSSASKSKTPLLPVELDFGDLNMSGPMALEFALLVLPDNEGLSSSSASGAANAGAANAGAANAGAASAASSAAAAAATLEGTPTILRSITLSDNALTGTIPGAAFQHLMPSLGKLYMDGNQLTGTIPVELGGLDTLYVQNNDLTGDWPQEFCDLGDKTINDFGLDCDKVECSSSCCGFLQCYFSSK